MSTVEPPPTVSTPSTYAQAPGRFHFMLRRMHSAMGLVFGGYIVVHLLVNATAVKPVDYQRNVDKIHSLEPMLWLIELVTIFIPLLIHVLYGTYIVKAGVKFNTTRYNYGGNIRYFLQRVTAIILLAFIIFHIGTLHKWGLMGLHHNIEKFHPIPYPLPTDANLYPDFSKLDMLQRFSFWCSDYGGKFTPHNQAFQSTANGIRNLIVYDDDPDGHNFHLANATIVAFYILGIWSAIFHLCNGLWTSAIAWGLTVTAASQRRWGHICLTFGIFMLIVGTIAWYAFTFSPNARPLKGPDGKPDGGGLMRWDDVTRTLPDVAH